MTIIYCPWGEWSKDDVVTSLTDLGHKVIEYNEIPSNYLDDATYVQNLVELMAEHGAEILFSMNYLPVVSQAAEIFNEKSLINNHVRYISWVYDCPHLTLYSKTILNECNHIFVFDREMGMEIASYGAPNVYHMPLAVNTSRIDSLIGKCDEKSLEKYSSEITFLGTLYEDDNNRFDQIAGLPDYIKGYAEALVNSQLLLYGYDIIETSFTDEICDQVLSHAVFDFGPDFFDIKKSVVRDWIRKKVTVRERRGLIDNILNNNLPVTLYAPEKPSNLPVDYRGYADYYKAMPLIFNQSRINLNITLRSIKSGIPLRVIDILGAGGFCLTNYQPEIAEYFENGKELVWFESPEDMIEKIQYYLSHDEERKAIAQAGYLRAKKDFNYHIKLDAILKAIDN